MSQGPGQPYFLGEEAHLAHCRTRAVRGASLNGKVRDSSDDASGTSPDGGAPEPTPEAPDGNEEAASTDSPDGPTDEALLAEWERLEAQLETQMLTATDENHRREIQSDMNRQMIPIRTELQRRGIEVE